MGFTVQAEAPPLREDATGALRIGKSRVLLELVIRAFQDGALPETIVQRYPTITLAEVYSVVAYFLRHRDEIDAYMTRREQQAVEVERQAGRDAGDLTAIRSRLLARRET